MRRLFGFQQKKKEERRNRTSRLTTLEQHATSPANEQRTLRIHKFVHFSLFWQQHRGQWQRLHKEVTAGRHVTRGHSCWLGPKQPPTFSLHSGGIMLSAGCAADKSWHEGEWTRNKWRSSTGLLCSPSERSDRRTPKKKRWRACLDFSRAIRGTNPSCAEHVLEGAEANSCQLRKWDNKKHGSSLVSQILINRCRYKSCTLTVTGAKSCKRKKPLGQSSLYIYIQYIVSLFQETHYSIIHLRCVAGSPTHPSQTRLS